MPEINKNGCYCMQAPIGEDGKPKFACHYCLNEILKEKNRLVEENWRLREVSEEAEKRL